MLNKLINDKYLKYVLAFTGVFYIASVILSFVKFYKRSTPIIIHFDSFKGIDLTGSRTDIFTFLILVLIMIVINFWIAEFIYNRERFLSYIFIFTTLVLGVLSFVAVAVIGIAN